MFGLSVGLFLAFLITLMNTSSGLPPYYWEIMLPGGLVGLIVGYATQKHLDRPARAARGVDPTQASPHHRTRRGRPNHHPAVIELSLTRHDSARCRTSLEGDSFQRGRHVRRLDGIQRQA
jgi:hypothetical protein